MAYNCVYLAAFLNNKNSLFVLMASLWTAWPPPPLIPVPSHFRSRVHWCFVTHKVTVTKRSPLPRRPYLCIYCYLFLLHLSSVLTNTLLSRPTSLTNPHVLPCASYYSLPWVWRFLSLTAGNGHSEGSIATLWRLHKKFRCNPTVTLICIVFIIIATTTIFLFILIYVMFSDAQIY